ncbi:MAG: energy-coupling factor transporter ATPase [Eubacteriales bacterium]|nr:energy-coupling factor transporter ATPase [Clostridiales bacterium]MDY4886846.1 energy-coupling factor transporter ATPase [Eubacteriales bacterium]
MAAKIELKHVTYAYGRGTPFEVVALDNVDLEIHPGLVTGIIGHTGSGKSTLVRLFNGLEKPESGNVLLDGKDIWENPKEIGKVRFRVGLVMQYPEYQLFEETVAADIAFGPKNMGLPNDEIQRRVAEYAALVGITEAETKKSPFDLSGGQKRRAAIAGVMAMEPEVLVLDEPAAGLDPEGKRLILGAVREYADRRKATVIIVSHSMEDMAELCDRVVVVSNGKILCNGTRDEVFSAAELLISSGLDVPELTRVAMLLAEKGYKTEKTVYTLEDATEEILKLCNRESV